MASPANRGGVALIPLVRTTPRGCPLSTRPAVAFAVVHVSNRPRIENTVQAVVLSKAVRCTRAIIYNTPILTIHECSQKGRCVFAFVGVFIYSRYLSACNTAPTTRDSRLVMKEQPLICTERPMEMDRVWMPITTRQTAARFSQTHPRCTGFGRKIVRKAAKRGGFRVKMEGKTAK